MSGEKPKCSICGKPLEDEEWIDDDNYGDVHVRCLESVGE